MKKLDTYLLNFLPERSLTRRTFPMLANVFAGMQISMPVCDLKN